MLWFSIILVGLIGTVLIITVKEYKPEIAIILSIAIGVIILLAAIKLISPIFNEIKEIIKSSTASSANINTLIKALGICYLTQFVSDVCNDSGQSSISTKVQLVGRIAICISALPLYKELIVLIKTIIEGI